LLALWIELLSACQDAYAKRDEALIRRFCEFARWCLKSPSDDVRTAVACAFYEHPLRDCEPWNALGICGRTRSLRV